MWYIWIGLILYCAWFAAMLFNRDFRTISNEIWNHYYVTSMKYAWPYVLIGAVYCVITDGSLAAFIRSAAGR